MNLTHAQRNLQSPLKTGKLLCGATVVSLELVLQTAWKGAVLEAVFLLKAQLSPGRNAALACPSCSQR